MKRALITFGLALMAGLFLASVPMSHAGSSYGIQGSSASSSKPARDVRKGERKGYRKRCHRGLFGVRTCDKHAPHRHFGPDDYDYAIGKGYHILR